MRELLLCFDDWLNRNGESASAHQLLRALVRESIKKAGQADQSAREFDAQELAAAANRAEQDDYVASKRWADRSNFAVYVDARRGALEEHFRAAGHSHCLRPVVKSTKGKHRASYFLEPYELGEESKTDGADPVKSDPTEIQYEFHAPGTVEPSWFGRLLLGSGSFITQSWRGLVWASLGAAALLLVFMNAGLLVAYSYVRHPLQTGDLASLVLLGGISWFFWIGLLRPFQWIVVDRIGSAGPLLVAFKEQEAQLELTIGDDGKRRLQLVRYRAVCPVCAGAVELQYGTGSNRRRLLGCCTELPQEHVYTFDKVLRRGKRMSSQGS